MKRGINSASQYQGLKVMKAIYSNNITQIHTRGALDRMIELSKFPWTKSFKSDKKTILKNQQYDPIRNWLIKQGFLTQTYDGYRYHYIVNKNKCII
jgi:hypothetical protein